MDPPNTIHLLKMKNFGKKKSGMVVHVYNPSTWEVEAEL
jgi:hypothetical protein